MPPASRGFTQSQVWRCILRRYYATGSPPGRQQKHENLPTRLRAQLEEAEKGKKSARSVEEILASRPPPPSPAELKKQHEEQQEEQDHKPPRSWLRGAVYPFMITIPITAFLLSHAPYEPKRVTGPSMRPTINPSCPSDHDLNYDATWVLLQKWNLYQLQQLNSRMRFGKNKGKSVQVIDRGDIVVYDTPHDPNKIAAKRVIAIAGDIVKPLPGYTKAQKENETTQTAEEVVVPFNHFWVEGDIGDKKKSVDSNYFGPISLPLIKGKVVAMWSPWWNIFSIRSARSVSEGYDWPAKKQGRVTENAVQAVSASPDKAAVVEMLQGERGQGMLRWIEMNGEAIKQQFENEDSYKLQVFKTYRESVTTARHNPDDEVRNMAKEIGHALEALLGVQAIYDVDPNAKRRKIRQRNPGVSEESIDELLLKSKSGLADAVRNV